VFRSQALFVLVVQEANAANSCKYSARPHTDELTPRGSQAVAGGAAISADYVLAKSRTTREFRARLAQKPIY